MPHPARQPLATSPHPRSPAIHPCSPAAGNASAPATWIQASSNLLGWHLQIRVDCLLFLFSIYSAA
ncbi:hypothetical protein BDA96_10G152900 [Sorghum bicolor]|uniref:Uncharacterized protein n=2 Tax=Sorghum bicolor TaxID=4558 RepID=A0A921U108_SORBI|nr:hypothetical protein BDA96_10G152900 [Sorghum bicolor]OQU76274.1 hypothetical protein SORBI_3010G123650 [Sorghum bicolor]